MSRIRLISVATILCFVTVAVLAQDVDHQIHKRDARTRKPRRQERNETTAGRDSSAGASADELPLLLPEDDIVSNQTEIGTNQNSTGTQAKEDEAEQRPAGKQNSTVTKHNSTELSQSGDILQEAEGASRVVGIPTEPHPGLKVLYKKPPVYPWPRGNFLDKTSAKSVLAPEQDSPPHPLNHHMTGHGILIDPTHALINHQIVEATTGYGDDSHDTHNYRPLPGVIDASKPLDIEYSNGGQGATRRLRKVGGNLNGTPLAVYRLIGGQQPERAHLTNIPVPNIERNRSEYGTDCFIHGFGAVHRKHLPDSELATKTLTDEEVWNFNRTERVHVKAPLEPITANDCRPDHRCWFTVQQPYTHCPSASGGAPIFCGPEQKLTYMTEHNTANGQCSATGMGYHIPRLMPAIDRNIKKQTAD